MASSMPSAGSPRSVRARPDRLRRRDGVPPDPGVASLLRPGHDGARPALGWRLPCRQLVRHDLFGLGLIAFVDETVFHQILGWHHFYDRGTTELGLLSDGVFHAVSWFATICSGSA